MNEAGTGVKVELSLTQPQLEMIDRFQEAKGLRSRGEAVALLLDVALEAVTGTGRRYWDKRITEAKE